MKVHLIRSEDFKMEDYKHVLNILNQYTGGITFVPSEPIDLPDTEIETTYENEDEYGRQIKGQYMDFSRSFFDDKSFPIIEKVYTWNDLFSVCIQYRMDFSIPADEQVFLLTNKKNDKNWFGAIDKRTYNNYFIDCSDWHYYFRGFDIRFPITYCVAGWLMRKLIFSSSDELLNAVHSESIGCLMDFCEEKREIVLKMRTADVCERCLHYSEKNDSNRVYMNQLFEIMDGVRSNLMFRKRSKYLHKNSRLEFRGKMHKMYLTDLGDLQVNLNPKERALYLVLLNHPEGISRRELVNYSNELFIYYDFFSTKWDNYSDYGDVNNINRYDRIMESLNLLTHPLEDNFLQVLSRIRRKFKNSVGEEQYKTYSIESEQGRYKILLDRELVSFDADAKLPNDKIYQ